MVVINDVNSQKFSFNGIEYFKNFTPVVIGEKVRILNAYDSAIELTSNPTLFSDFVVDGNTFLNVAALQTALLPVLYTRSTLGGGGASAFTDLTDVPSAYTGQGGKVVSVKGTEDGLEFTTAASGGGYIELIHKQTTDQSLVSLSATRQTLYSYLVPANTYAVGDVVRLRAISKKSGTTAGYITYITIGTTNNPDTDTVVGLSNTSTNNRLTGLLDRSFIVKDTYTEHLRNDVNVGYDFAIANNLGLSQTVIDWTVDNYIILSATGNASDSAQCVYFELTKQ